METDYLRSFSIKSETFSIFENTVRQSIDSFITENRVIDSLENGTIELSHYHSLLISLFHQVFNSSGSFALAGSMCSTKQIAAREYLFHHAEEEMTHWQWILSDLKNTGYTGPDPRDISPPVSSTAYLSYAYYLALKYPIGRLGMALVLEGISGSFGLKYGQLLAKKLKLKPDQTQFFLAHGELDQGHEEDILKILSKSELTDSDFGQLSYIAKTTSALYKRIYNESL